MSGPGPTGPTLRVGALFASFLAVVTAALVVSLMSAVSTVVLGVILLGVLHAVLELRYVTGRFSGLALGLGRPFLRLLAVLVAGIVVARLLGGLVGRPGNIVEVVLGYTIVAVSVPRVLGRGQWSWAWVLTGVAAVASLRWPEQHFLALVHLHLVAVVAFLWEWSGRLPSVRSRRVFRALQVGWALVIPLLILVGAADEWIGTDTTFVRSLVGDGHGVIAGVQPTGEDATVGSRLLAVFALLQTMHLLTWVVFFPRHAPDAAADLEERLPWLTGARVWAIGFLAAALFAVLLVSNYSLGVGVQDALTSPHAYLEIPLLLALLGRGRRTVSESEPTDGRPMRREPVRDNPLAAAVTPSYGRGKQQGRR